MSNWSTSMPKRAAQNVFWIGIRTVPFSAERVKYAFGICRVVDLQGDGEAFGYLIAIRRSVRPHQHPVAHNEAAVQDRLAPLSRHMFRRRRTFMGHHRDDLAAQTSFIELECRLALAAEQQVRIQLHGAPPLPRRD